MRPNPLDFTASGQAVIDMPNFREISFLENFGFSPIESVEHEIKDALPNYLNHILTRMKKRNRLTFIR